MYSLGLRQAPGTGPVARSRIDPGTAKEVLVSTKVPLVIHPLSLPASPSVAPGSKGTPDPLRRACRANAGAARLATALPNWSHPHVPAQPREGSSLFSGGFRLSVKL